MTPRLRVFFKAVESLLAEAVPKVAVFRAFRGGVGSVSSGSGAVSSSVARFFVIFARVAFLAFGVGLTLLKVA